MAGKTGTSSNNRDSWFGGFSGSHLVMVWVGYDDNKSTGLYGSSGALPVWAQIMSSIDTTSWEQPLPESLVETNMDFYTGLGVTPECEPRPVVVAVPQDTQLTMREGCVAHTGGIVENAGDWLRGMIGR